MNTYITNASNEKIFVTVNLVENAKGLAIIMHGLGGNHESGYIKLINQSCQDQGLITVRFDCRNTFGKSDGELDNATITNYIQDLHTVMQWVKKQEWFISPYIMFAHSLGGISILEYAKNNQDELLGIAPLASVMSGELSWKTKKYSPKMLQEWKEKGYREWESSHVNKKLLYNHKLDRDKYDATKYAKDFKIPILLISGTQDESTPVEHQKEFLKHLVCENEFHIIPNMKHSPSDTFHTELDKIIQAWIHKILMRSSYEK